jgi:hypothetical protein
MKYLRYFKQVLVHKFHVFHYCWNFGIPWLGLIHDLSKFRPSEFIPHARYFGIPEKDRTSELQADLDRAWLIHQNRNKHHWNYWLMVSEGKMLVFAPPFKYVKEMLADWFARCHYRDNRALHEWYRSYYIILHPDVKKFTDWVVEMEEKHWRDIKEKSYTVN